MYEEDALAYLSFGWGVFPSHAVYNGGSCTCGRLDCPSPGKHPIGSWAAYRDRLPSELEVKAWFGSMLCNVGMITGMVSGGLVVVDVDGREGKESIKDLGLAPTLTSNTGGGGFHYFYRTSKPVPSKVRILPGVDIRGEGGYIVLPPSLHISGRRYEWSENPIPIAEFNPKLFNWNGSNGRRLMQNLSADDSWYAYYISGVGEGERNVALARLAGRYFGMGLSYSEVYLMLDAWNNRNHPPLPDFELQRTLKAIWRKHQSEVMPMRIETLNQIKQLLKGGFSGD